ncbi:hypothetical protein H072_1275 [Dactylellina haptotyla CBS 200.50]|uniref:Uncharacterized protein n=1 Tax=Dactylellina haptotyla (strain CBS 200.50) TaxID=1284197 RepID=S8APG7_DACHA|nr:hypothetical protein H072_1275 [Dactylellina haptotyla CBS 200.50]
MAHPPSNHERNAQSTSVSKKKRSKRSKKDTDDDTPKAFQRLMAYAATGKRPSGLDDPKTSSKNPKKRKRNDITNDTLSTAAESSHLEATADTEAPSRPTDKPLSLLPGEKLSDFSRRVDAAIPISFKGLQRGEDNPKNKKKKKKATADGEQPEEEEITEDMYDFDDNGDPLPNHLKPHDHRKSARSSTKAAPTVGSNKKGQKERSPSPFSVLRQKRGNVQSSINDVVQAPPTSLVVPKEKLRDKTKGGGGGVIHSLEVPKSSGSLARREMLDVERKNVLERYRALMAARSGGM